MYLLPIRFVLFLESITSACPFGLAKVFQATEGHKPANKTMKITLMHNTKFFMAKYLDLHYLGLQRR
jgi:hypothetical protein